jgi:hypothetical protein
MKDNELRGLILRKYYDKRREGWFQWSDEDFKDLPDTVEFDAVDLFRVCDQLGEHGLIEWNGVQGVGGQTIGGAGKISAYGVDVIEGHAKSPISVIFDQSHHVSVTESSNVQIGDANIQDVSVHLEKLVAAINDSSASPAEKEEAKSLLKKFLEHPLVISVAKGLASNIKL